MEPNMSKMLSLKMDIQTIKNKIQECKNNNITDSFKMEMKIIEDLPELYDQYPGMIKRFTKYTDETILNKFLDALEMVIKGEKSLASVELELGMYLKERFVDPVLEENKRKEKMH